MYFYVHLKAIISINKKKKVVFETADAYYVYRYNPFTERKPVSLFQVPQCNHDQIIDVTVQPLFLFVP